VKRQQPMNREHVKKIIAAAMSCSLRDGCILMLASSHAMRSSEIAGLKVSDINLKSGRIDIRRKKGSNSGTDSLSAEEIKTLSLYLKIKPQHPLLFPSTKPNSNRQANALSSVQVYRIFRRYAELTNTPDVSRAPHAFRHSLAQHCADHQMDIKVLQRVMGHKNINSTATYYDKTQAQIDSERQRVLA
jgi:type 1 fimbriae regulatory protein FimB